MLVNFDEIIEVVLHHEGGYVNDPKDPGGETNFGIAKRSQILLWACMLQLFNQSFAGKCVYGVKRLQGIIHI